MIESYIKTLTKNERGLKILEFIKTFYQIFFNALTSLILVIFLAVGWFESEV